MAADDGSQQQDAAKQADADNTKLSQVSVYSQLDQLLILTLCYLFLVLQPLLERLDEYHVDESVADKPNLVKLPPDFKPVPCKPLFFDLALNSVEYPNLDTEKTSTPTGEKGGGLLDKMKIWSWGGK